MALRRPGPQVLEPEPLCFAADFSQPAERQAKPGIQSDTDNHGCSMPKITLANCHGAGGFPAAIPGSVKGCRLGTSLRATHLPSVTVK